MFQKRARNFRARKAESSSSGGGSSAEEEEPGPVAPPGGEDQEQGQQKVNSRPRAARGLVCSSRGRPGGARTGGGLLSQRSDSPPVIGAESAPVTAGDPEQRSSSSLLSFGAQAEGDEEQFQIKKPNYSEVVFKVQKKSIQGSPDRHIQKNQEILTIKDATNVNPKDVHEVEELGESSGSEGSNSSSSSQSSSQSSTSQSSSSQEKPSMLSGAVPDKQCIMAARRKRLLAREQGDYIALDVSLRKPKRSSDTTYGDDEIDDHEKRIAFAPKPKTLRQRIAEKLEPQSSEGSDDSEENDIQDKWEEQQIRKAVKVPQRNDSDGSSPRRNYVVKTTFKPSLPRPVVNLENVKRQLSARLTSFEEVHRSHKQEYNKMEHDVESSKNTIEKLENTSNAALQHKFYKSMKIYADNLADCLNEKISRINELEASSHLMQHEKAKTLLQRRQEVLQNESAAIQRSGKSASSVTHEEGAGLQQLLEECMSRRTVRKEARETLGKSDHHDGMSSDDDLSQAKLVNLQQERDKILKESKKIFEDVHKDFCGIRNILMKFQEWREKFPDSYYDAYISLCLPKLLNPLIRIQLIAWNPLEGSLDLEQMPWFRSIKDYCIAKRETELVDEGSCDKEILPKIIEKTIIPKITDFVEHVWDPLSSTQTNNLVELCKTVLTDYEPNKGKQELLNLVVSRLRQSIDDDVYIPLYSKSDLEDNNSPHAVFQERQFWTAVKLLHNVLQWDGLVEEQALQELSLNKLLNRYLLLVLLNAQPGPQSLEKCVKIVSYLPEGWFKDLNSGATLPQLANLSKHLLQFGHAMHKKNCRLETGEVALLLIRIKAVDSAEVLIHEYGLHDLKTSTEK